MGSIGELDKGNDSSGLSSITLGASACMETILVAPKGLDIDVAAHHGF